MFLKEKKKKTKELCKVVTLFNKSFFFFYFVTINKLFFNLYKLIPIKFIYTPRTAHLKLPQLIYFFKLCPSSKFQTKKKRF